MISAAHIVLSRLVRRDRRDYAPWGRVLREELEHDPDCSRGCRYALWLEDLPHDWLVCANPASHRVGLLTFEHQGCPQFKGEDE